MGIKPVDALRILLVGSPVSLKSITGALLAGGHEILPADTVAEAEEALLIQRFDAVLVGNLDSEQIHQLTCQIRSVEKRTGASTRTAVLSVVAEPADAASTGKNADIDGYVQGTVDPDTLTLAIARLASAVGTGSVEAEPLGEELPVLNVEGLKEQVAYDDELLVELIDLFLSERVKQVIEMREAFAAGNFDQLSRVAHTIKGSLGSLHAMVAKTNAQGLEIAAKEHDAVRSQGFLGALEQDLDILEGELLKVRRSVSP